MREGELFLGVLGWRAKYTQSDSGALQILMRIFLWKISHSRGILSYDQIFICNFGKISRGCGGLEATPVGRREKNKRQTEQENYIYIIDVFLTVLYINWDVGQFHHSFLTFLIYGNIKRNMIFSCLFCQLHCDTNIFPSLNEVWIFGCTCYTDTDWIEKLKKQSLIGNNCCVLTG